MASYLNFDAKKQQKMRRFIALILYFSTAEFCHMIVILIRQYRAAY